MIINTVNLLWLLSLLFESYISSLEMKNFNININIFNVGVNFIFNNKLKKKEKNLVIKVCLP